MKAYLSKFLLISLLLSGVSAIDAVPAAEVKKEEVAPSWYSNLYQKARAQITRKQIAAAIGAVMVGAVVYKTKGFGVIPRIQTARFNKAVKDARKVELETIGKEFGSRRKQIIAQLEHPAKLVKERMAESKKIGEEFGPRRKNIKEELTKARAEAAARTDAAAAGRATYAVPLTASASTSTVTSTTTSSSTSTPVARQNYFSFLNGWEISDNEPMFETL